MYVVCGSTILRSLWFYRCLELAIIDPKSPTYYLWLCIMMVAVLYNVVFIIARHVFDQLQDDYREAWITFDCLVDLVYLLDMLVRVRTSKLSLTMY